MTMLARVRKPTSVKTRLSVGCLLFTASALWVTAATEVENELPPSVILAERRGEFPLTGLSWDADTIENNSPRSIDELLAGDPSFSLYRRQSAIFSNPSTTGVSLGNTGATAASRSLVIRDGIPQNDPFGSWVSWTRYNPATLASARIASATESLIWGNMSAAGSVQLTSKEIDQDSITLRAIGGSQNSYGGSLTVDQISKSGELAASLHLFSLHSDGFYSLHESQRGEVDRRLDLNYAGADLRLKWQPRPDFTLEPVFSFYEEERGNGTVLSRNASQAFDFSLRATHEHQSGTTQYLAYYQQRDFSSVFASVAADRNSERIALNQYAVPGEGYGGAIIQQREVNEYLDVSVGADLRFLTGQTNEDAGTFRRRHAGGRQAFAGLFTRANWIMNDDTRLGASLRLDHWSMTDGFRHELSLASGVTLREHHYPDRSAIEPSVSLLIQHEASEDLSAWASAGTSFRVPSINELYRPYRVRSDVTEANPMLEPERFFSLEFGMKWHRAETLTISSAIYHHWIQDAIANVPVTEPAEIARIFGSLPAGGTGSQKQNVDQARVLGLRTSVEWAPDPVVSFRFDGLWSHTRFSASPRQPMIEGEAFPQAPDLRLIGTMTVSPADRWSFFAGVEYAGSVFDDMLGQRQLPSYWTCRLGGSWQANDVLSLSLRVENLLDQEIPTGLASNGLRSIGQPRAIWVGAEYAF